MARLKQYDKGYLDGQLAEAEVALDNLYGIIREQNMKGNQFDPSDFIYSYIRDIEAFLREHGRIE